MTHHNIWRITPIITIAIVILLLVPVPAGAQPERVQVLFMHHSTGEGVIWQGGVREAFTALGYDFWDHGYNEEGLVDPTGNYLGVNWNVPGDNTDPDGWFNIFNQPVTDPPSNTFSHMLAYDVVIFKSCFPSSNIDSDAMFQEYQRYFLSMRDVMDQHPDTLFIPFTTPPLVPNETSTENAARARRWAEYLTSDEYLAGHPNIQVFDFFSHLADENGFLRAEYRSDEWDSHPNEIANRAVGPVLVTFVDQAVREFEPGMAPPPGEVPLPAEPVEQPEVETGGEDITGYQAYQASDLFDGFESVESADWWWDYINDGVTAFDCGLDQPGYSGDHALRLAFDLSPEGGAGCGVDFAPDPAWAEAAGFSFYWRADQPDLVMRVGLAVEDPARPYADSGEATPFEVELISADSGWQHVTILWDDLVKPEWVGDTGIDAFDPASVVWVVFDVGYWERPQVGSIWIDDLQLLPVE